MFNHGSFLYFSNISYGTDLNSGQAVTLFSESEVLEVGSSMYYPDETTLFEKVGYILKTSSNIVFFVDADGVIVEIVNLTTLLQPPAPPTPVTYYSLGLFKRHLTDSDFENNRPVEEILVGLSRTNNELVVVGDKILDVNNVLLDKDGTYTKDDVTGYRIVKGVITEIIILD